MRLNNRPHSSSFPTRSDTLRRPKNTTLLSSIHSPLASVVSLRFTPFRQPSSPSNAPPSPRCRRGFLLHPAKGGQRRTAGWRDVEGRYGTWRVVHWKVSRALSVYCRGESDRLVVPSSQMTDKQMTMELSQPRPSRSPSPSEHPTPDTLLLPNPNSFKLGPNPYPHSNPHSNYFLLTFPPNQYLIFDTSPSLSPSLSLSLSLSLSFFLSLGEGRRST